MIKETKVSTDSSVQNQVHWVFPGDLNANDTVFGGMIMAQMDRICAVVANRHAGAVCVTASVDAVHFMAPARRGDVLLFSASVNRAWRTSMEIGCRVEAELESSTDDDQCRHILSAYLTFVAVDDEGKPMSVPQLEVVDDVGRRRYAEAALRRQNRLNHVDELKHLRAKEGWKTTQ